MKRILAFLLVAVMALTLLASCAEDGVSQVAKYYENSAPNKIVAVSTQQFGSHLIDMTTTITKGYVNAKDAATKTVVGKRMRSLEEGSGDTVHAYIEDIDTTEWYVDGMGVSTDKGYTWDAYGETFVPEAGLIAINLDKALLEEVSYVDNTLEFKVAKDNVAAVFSDSIEDMTGDVECKIYDDGAVVTGITVTWTLPADADENFIGEDMEISIVVTYTYDLERLNITLK